MLYEHFSMLTTLMFVCLFAVSNLGGAGPLDRDKVGLSAMTGKVFRSDSDTVISNSYILLTQEKNSASDVQHFDVRTDENGKYIFRAIPAGNYTVSVFAWFPNKTDVPCQNPLEHKTTDGENVTVEWQRKSQTFMEIVTIKGFSVGAGQRTAKDFDIFCRRMASAIQPVYLGPD